MKKIVVMLLLIVSTNVFAEWTKIGVTDTRTNYLDFGTIKKKGENVGINGRKDSSGWCWK
jgi:hypothetical protein